MLGGILMNLKNILGIIVLLTAIGGIIIGFTNKPLITPYSIVCILIILILFFIMNKYEQSKK